MEGVASAENEAGNARGACIVKGPHLGGKGEGMEVREGLGDKDLVL